MNDVWSSVDGKTWIPATVPTTFTARAGHTNLNFNGRLWVIAGQDANSNLLNDVWNSEDGVNWHLVTPAAAFPPRYLHTSAVFNDRMWVIGGIGSKGHLSDVWSSADGVTWIRETAAPDQKIVSYLLGRTTDSTGLDKNSDNHVDISDAILSVKHAP